MKYFFTSFMQNYFFFTCVCDGQRPRQSRIKLFVYLIKTMNGSRCRRPWGYVLMLSTKPKCPTKQFPEREVQFFSLCKVTKPCNCFPAHLISRSLFIGALSRIMLWFKLITESAIRPDAGLQNYVISRASGLLRAKFV